MSSEREVRKETDFWGNEKEVVYQNDRKIGEVKIEERGGFLGIGGESVKVEYDSSGREVSHSKQEERGGFLGIGAEQVEVRYDSSDNEIGHSRVEERGGFLGIGGHHVRVEYDNDQREISQTNTERRGDFLGIGGERVRVTRYSKTDANEAHYPTHSVSSDGGGGSGGVSKGIFVVGIIALIVVALSSTSSPNNNDSTVATVPSVSIVNTEQQKQHELGRQRQIEEAERIKSEEKAAKERMAAEELAAQEERALEEIAAKERMAAEELAAQEQRALEEIAAKERMAAEELAAQEQRALEEKAAQERTNLRASNFADIEAAKQWRQSGNIIAAAQHINAILARDPNNSTAQEYYNNWRLDRVCNECGVVSRKWEEIVEGNGTVPGALVGGAVGYALKTKSGSSQRNNLAPIIGAVAGALIGNKTSRKTLYQVELQLDKGTRVVYTFTDNVALQLGDRIVVAVSGQNVSITTQP